MSSPDFLCIGTQKAGTSWLHYMLRGHSSFWVPPVKELQFFNNYFDPDSLGWTGRSRLDRAKDFISYNLAREVVDWDEIRAAALIAQEEVNLDWYQSIFDLAPPGRIKGEITPEYTLLKQDQIKALATLYPNLRIVFGMREPVSRAVSAIRMLLLHEGFNEAHSPKDYEERAIGMARDSDNIIRSAYLTVLERWASAFSADRIFCYDFDYIASEPMTILSGLCRFFSVDGSKFRANPRARIHPGSKLELSDKVMAVINETHCENVREYQELRKALKYGVATYAAMH